MIGVVTSPTGAVIRDILHRLEDRFPSHVMLWPVPVQGEGAAGADRGGGRRLQRAAPAAGAAPDLLIVARGGGSIEDLWAFNEEVVVRAVAGSAIPIISAVGHETDTTLCDFAADVRAPTPTAAAEMAVPVRASCSPRCASSAPAPSAAPAARSSAAAEQLQALLRHWPEREALLAPQQQRLDELAERLPRGAARPARPRPRRARPCRRRAAAGPARRGPSPGARAARRARGGSPSSPIPTGRSRRGYARVEDRDGQHPDLGRRRRARRACCGCIFRDGAVEAAVGDAPAAAAARTAGRLC